MSLNNSFIEKVLAVFSYDYSLILRKEVTQVEHFDLLHYFCYFMNNKPFKQVWLSSFIKDTYV